jgi:hypothetical protein
MYATKRVDPHALFASVRRALTGRLADGAPFVTALDDTRLRKCGRKTHGVKSTRDPLGPPFHVNFIKAQRFLQLSMAAAADNGQVRMIPVDFVHAPAPQKPPAQAAAEVQAQFRTAQRTHSLPTVGAERVRRLRDAMDRDHQSRRPLWAVVDGGYTNGSFLKALPARTQAIGRIRADAKLYYLPPSAPDKPGRHRVYGQRAPTPEALRQDAAVPWTAVTAFAAGQTHQFKVKTLGPLRWRPAGQAHDLRLIVIAPLGYRLTHNGRILYRKAAFLISTEPDADLQQVLQAYLWRWDIEVNFRDEKNILGVGQAQVRQKQSVETVPALAVAAYAMLLTSALQAYGPTGQPESLPAPKWRRTPNPRASTQSLVNQLRQEVWASAFHPSGFVSPHPLHTKPQKFEPSLEGALFYANA